MAAGRCTAPQHLGPVPRSSTRDWSATPRTFLHHAFHHARPVALAAPSARTSGRQAFFAVPALSKGRQLSSVQTLTMLLRLQPRADERAALAFEDLASGIDAGLSLAALGIDAAAHERVLPDLFARRRIALDPSEDLVLVAAWRAGRSPVSLRLLAEQRRSRAQLARTIAGGLLSPTLLCVVAMVVSFVLASLPGMRW